MNIVEKPISELKEYKNNPRNNDNAVDAVAKSIQEFGFKQPIVIDANNEIVAGHTRYKASIKLGIDKVPCIVASDLTPKQIKAYRLADNKVGELATWNIDLLTPELADLTDFGFDMSTFGFEQQGYLDELDQIVQDDVPEIDDAVEPITKIGDVYQLGNHRLICGDCTQSSVLAKLMNGQ